MFKCGVRGIRTHDTCYCIHAFQACVFNHSAITPKKENHYKKNKKNIIYKKYKKLYITKYIVIKLTTKINPTKVNL